MISVLTWGIHSVHIISVLTWGIHSVPMCAEERSSLEEVYTVTRSGDRQEIGRRLVREEVVTDN